MPGPFDPSLHPHGYHGFWQFNGGRGKHGQGLAGRIAGRGKAAAQALKPQIDVVSRDGVRTRARATSGQAFNHGPASGVPAKSGELQPRILGTLKQGANVKVNINGKFHPGKVIHLHRTSAATHHVKVRTAKGVQIHHVKEIKVKTHPTRHNAYPKPSAYVDHVPIGRWWAGATGRGRNGALPYSPNRPSRTGLAVPVKGGPRGGAKRPSVGRVHKDVMTVTEDLGHDGQSPVTIMQGGSTLQRCPKCGRKLTMDGHCPVHGNALANKALLRTGGAVLRKDMDTTYIPSTGEARAPRTVHPQGRQTKKPPANTPVGPPECPDCGGTDGYHNPMCPRAVLNPGGGPSGLGA